MSQSEHKKFAEANAMMSGMFNHEQQEKWRLQRERKADKRQNKLDEKNAGVINPNAMSEWYDEHGDLLDDAEPPQWAVALHKAHKAEPGMREFRDFGVHRYSQPARTIKKRPTNRDRKIKELEATGYNIGSDGYIEGFDKVLVMTNGRVEIEETGERMMMYQFIRDYC